MKLRTFNLNVFELYLYFSCSHHPYMSIKELKRMEKKILKHPIELSLMEMLLLEFD